MATNGRVEAQITIPTGGWSFTMEVDGLVGSSVRTIAAGAYWPQDLAAEFASELEDGEAVLGGAGTYALGSTFTETGAGLLRVARAPSGTNFDVTWGSTDLRDALGFAGTISGDDEYLGTSVLGGIWLPHAILAAPRGVDDGHTEMDRTVSVSPRGHVKALGYASRKRLRVTWSHVLARYTLESQETTEGESFERWWLDTHGGRVSYFGRAPLCRLYWSANDAAYVELRLTEPMNTFNPERSDPSWIGLWPITIGGYVVPS